MNDAVNNPSHYTTHPSGVECIVLAEAMSFNLGNALKYVWRAGLKSETPIEDLRKAVWYVTREMARTDRQYDRRRTSPVHPFVGRVVHASDDALTANAISALWTATCFDRDGELDAALVAVMRLLARAELDALPKASSRSAT